MDIRPNVRVNLEEAIKAVQAVVHLSTLQWNEIDWYSNGEQVDLIDHAVDLNNDDKIIICDVADYIRHSNYIIVPKQIEETIKDE